MIQPAEPYAELLELAEDRAYQKGVDLCFSVLDDGGEIDRAFWTLHIGLLYFLNFWENGTLFEEAPRFTEKALWLDATRSEIHFWHGHVVEISFKDYTQAQDQYDDCLEIEPDHVYAHLAMATLNLPPETAKSHLEQILAQQPNNYRALMLYADACTKLDLGGAAIAAYEKVIESEPYFEHSRGIMNRYINTEMTFASLRAGVVKDAQKKLDALRRPRA
ncbi:MAG: tetratricopeptide repeat protein [Dehalococcoidia bacterium]